MKSARSSPTPVPAPTHRPRIVNRRWILLAVVLLAVSAGVFADWWIAIPAEAEAHYVGGKSCIECHAKEHQDWHGSYHDLAMDHATEETVLGDFNDSSLSHFGIESRMFRRDGKFMVATEGPDGKVADFEVKYVLGVSPLQQYMVEFERPEDAQLNEVARLQVLPISWDTKNKKWFVLQPPDVNERLAPNDDLHWTGIAQRWNNMCADCHVTNLQKNFDVASKTYRTTFTDIDVNCESCHGPGSLHVELASAKSLFWDRNRGYALAKLKGQASSQAEIETCAPCHSMRRIVHPGFKAGDQYFDYFANELLQGHLYHADGQIMEEVYEIGSFTQSKMYHKNIRCSDCHDPHSTKVKHEGNQVCTSCHQHPAGKYDTPAHHHHTPGSTGAKCTNCHMPTKTYMAVDPRLDHSIRVPRPDLSVELSTPNACSGCHLEKGQLPEQRAAELGEYANWLRAARTDGDVRSSLKRVDEWSAQRFEEWYGKKKDVDSHFAHALSSARRGDSTAVDRLVELAGRRDLPAIVRATCLFELGQFESSAANSLAVKLLDDPEPILRMMAVSHLERLPDDELVRHVVPALRDPIRAVRTEAGRVLARVDERLLNGPERDLRQNAVEEFKHGLLANSDRAVSHMGLGILAERQQNDREAIAAYETAIHVEPNTAGPRANLAAVLERQLAAEPASAERAQLESRISQLRKEELELLARDAKLLPESAAIRYRYGLSLYIHGRLDEAEAELLAAVKYAPNSSDCVLALALLYQKQQKFADALSLARRLIELRPDDPSYAKLLTELQAQADGTQK